MKKSKATCCRLHGRLLLLYVTRKSQRLPYTIYYHWNVVDT